VFSFHARESGHRPRGASSTIVERKDWETRYGWEEEFWEMTVLLVTTPATVSLRLFRSSMAEIASNFSTNARDQRSREHERRIAEREHCCPSQPKYRRLASSSPKISF
jgi:hypothetical protein